MLLLDDTVCSKGLMLYELLKACFISYIYIYIYHIYAYLCIITHTHIYMYIYIYIYILTLAKILIILQMLLKIDIKYEKIFTDTDSCFDKHTKINT